MIYTTSPMPTHVCDYDVSIDALWSTTHSKFDYYLCRIERASTAEKLALVRTEIDNSTKRGELTVEEANRLCAVSLMACTAIKWYNRAVKLANILTEENPEK